MKSIPFVPFPLEKAAKFSKSFLWLSNKLVKFNPFLSKTLIQADIELKDREYMAIAIFSSLFWFFIIFLVFTLFGIYLGENVLAISFIFSIFISSVSFMYINFYPNLIITKKGRDLDRNLIFAIRHLFIQVKSGVSLFDGMVSVSKGDYGIVSQEFEKCTKEIATGRDEIQSLEELAFRNPEISFKRVIWQIVNSLRAGGDIGNTLSILAENLSEEQKVKIRKYGSQLSPMALMYLMFTVILPTLGLTFLIIFSTFSGIQVPETLFYLILFSLTVFQFMFLGMAKSRRPSVEV